MCECTSSSIIIYLHETKTMNKSNNCFKLGKKPHDQIIWSNTQIKGLKQYLFTKSDIKYTKCNPLFKNSNSMSKTPYQLALKTFGSNVTFSHVGTKGCFKVGNITVIHTSINLALLKIVSALQASQTVWRGRVWTALSPWAGSLWF